MSEQTKVFDLKVVDGRLVIDMGERPMKEGEYFSDEHYGYDGKPTLIDFCEMGEAKLIGEVHLTEHAVKKIMAEYENGGECAWCGDVAPKLRFCHQFDMGSAEQKMCKNCWNHDRGVYLGSYGEDIEPFDEEDDSKQCVVCGTFYEMKDLLELENGEHECQSCAQRMNDMAP
jgi:hypothetical protein